MRSFVETPLPSRFGVCTKTVAVYSVSGFNPVKQWDDSEPVTVISCPRDPVYPHKLYYWNGNKPHLKMNITKI